MSGVKVVAVFLAFDSSGGGIYQYCTSIIEAALKLPLDAWKVEVVCGQPSWSKYCEQKKIPHFLIQPGYLDRFLWHFLSLIQVPLQFRQVMMKTLSPFGRKLNFLKCDYWIFPSQDAWSYRLDFNSIVSIHDLMHRYERKFPEVSERGEFRRREENYKLIAETAKAILVDSKLGITHVVESYRPKARVYDLPYVPSHSLLEAALPVNLETRFRLPQKYFIYPAQFWPHKNHERLIRACKILHDEGVPVSLVLSGGSGERARPIVELVAELQLSRHIIFVGYLNDGELKGLYQKARALLMPTFFGPTNIPPLEAQALGCPVAVSNVYAMPEQMGNSAMYFDPKNTKDIANVMKELWLDDELCAKLRGLGLENAKRHTQINFNKRFENILNELEE